MIEGPKLSNFKIEGPILQNGEDRGTKTAIKSNKKKLTQFNPLLMFFLTFRL